MPKWTQHEFDEYQRLTGHPHPFDRPCSGVQKQEDHCGQEINHGPEGTKVDGGSDRQYALTVEILVSDRRNRDLDGALATLCDCLVAEGRQLESDTEDYRQREGGSEGGGRRKH